MRNDTDVEPMTWGDLHMAVMKWSSEISPVECEAYRVFEDESSHFFGPRPWNGPHVDSVVPAEFVERWMDVVQGKSPRYDPETGNKRPDH